MPPMFLLTFFFAIVCASTARAGPFDFAQDKPAADLPIDAVPSRSLTISVAARPGAPAAAAAAESTEDIRQALLNYPEWFRVLEPGESNAEATLEVAGRSAKDGNVDLDGHLSIFDFHKGPLMVWLPSARCGMPACRRLLAKQFADKVRATAALYLKEIESRIAPQPAAAADPAPDPPPPAAPVAVPVAAPSAPPPRGLALDVTEIPPPPIASRANVQVINESANAVWLAVGGAKYHVRPRVPLALSLAIGEAKLVVDAPGLVPLADSKPIAAGKAYRWRVYVK